MKTQLLAVGVVAMTLIAGAAVACYAADAETPKAVIAEVGELGENIYDLAKDKDWTAVAGKLTSLKKEAESLQSQVKEAKEAKEQLSKSIAALERAVGAKDQHVTMQEANQITLIAANLTEPFHPQVPADITRLDYYGRELEIWSAVKNEAKLKEAADALQKTWDKVRPSVKQHGGTAEAKTFDGLMLKLKAAKSPKQYESIATPILDEVDNLEKGLHEIAAAVAPAETGYRLRSPGAAFVDIVFLWAAITATMIAFWRRSLVAGLLFVPGELRRRVELRHLAAEWVPTPSKRRNVGRAKHHGAWQAGTSSVCLST